MDPSPEDLAKLLESRNAQIANLQGEIKKLEDVIKEQQQFIAKAKEANPADTFLAEVFGSHLSKQEKLYSTNVGVHDMSVEELVDAFVTLYDEGRSSSRASSIKSQRVENFLKKYEETVAYIKKKRMNPGKFQIVKTIGQGSFADILLVKMTDSDGAADRPYVLKRMLKSKVHSEAMVVWPDVELEVMVKANRNKSPGIVRLQSAFHDPLHLYFALDFYVGGDMLCMLDRKVTFSESWAMFYFAEMAVAVQSVHDLGFIHRDLKIENFLLHQSGHVVLTDFGSACPMIDKKSSQNIYVNSEYMAPELVRILRGETVTYGPGADWWGLGVILFEMLTGDVPFIGDDLGTVMATNRIINFKTEFAFPDHVTLSDEIKSLVHGLIEDEDKRFGFEEIKNHPIYAHVNWDALISNLQTFTTAQKSNLSLPFKPETVGAFDTTFFDKFEDDELIDKLGDGLVEDTINRKSRSVTRTQSQSLQGAYVFGDLLPYVGFSYQRPIEKGKNKRVRAAGFNIRNLTARFEDPNGPVAKTGAIEKKIGRNVGAGWERKVTDLIKEPIMTKRKISMPAAVSTGSQMLNTAQIVKGKQLQTTKTNISPALSVEKEPTPTTPASVTTPPLDTKESSIATTTTTTTITTTTPSSDSPPSTSPANKNIDPLKKHIRSNSEGLPNTNVETATTKSAIPRVKFTDDIVFFDCAKNKDADSVQNMLDASVASVGSVTDSFNQSSLHIACMYGATNVVQLLVERGADVNLQDDLLCTPLHLALVSGHNKISQYLLDHGGDVNIEDSEGCTAIDMTEDPALQAAIALGVKEV